MSETPRPPFTLESEERKARAAEDAWNTRRIASINDLAFVGSERLFFWAFGARPSGRPGSSELGL